MRSLTITSIATASRSQQILRDICLILGASLLLGLFARISIFLPFSPVPFIFQSHVALFLGAVLGSKRGALAALAFLIEGAFGLPFFAGGGGILYLMGPTGGYLLAYVPAAYLTGYLVERTHSFSPSKLFAAMAMGNGIIYALGLVGLAKFVGFKMAIVLGCLPFLAGDFLKLVLFTKLAEKKKSF